MATKKQTATDIAEKEKQTEQAERETEIRVRINKLFDDESSKLRALASANIGGGFAVHGIKVMDTDKGLFVAMPSRSYKGANGETKYEELFHPVTAEARNALYGAVTDAYNEAIEQAQNEEQDAGIGGMNM